MIIYQYDGRTDWTTANKTSCQAGYIVIRDTDSERVQKFQHPEQYGAVHGAVYESAFGERLDNNNVVGEGFSIMKGEFEGNSRTFNESDPGPSPRHDGTRSMSEISKKCVREVVKVWMKVDMKILGHIHFNVRELLVETE